jgi:hypothetical protein
MERACRVMAPKYEPFDWDPEYSDSDLLRSVDAARAIPLLPGIYGVEVFRGPTYNKSGYGDQDGGQDNRGRSIAPDTKTLTSWAEMWVKGERRGSWSPYRSVVVMWDGGDSLMFYKAADQGWFDVARYIDNCPSQRHPRHATVLLKFDRIVEAVYVANGRSVAEARKDIDDERQEVYCWSHWHSALSWRIIDFKWVQILPMEVENVGGAAEPINVHVLQDLERSEASSEMSEAYSELSEATSQGSA